MTWIIQIMIVVNNVNSCWKEKLTGQMHGAISLEMIDILIKTNLIRFNNHHHKSFHRIQIENGW